MMDRATYRAEYIRLAKAFGIPEERAAEHEATLSCGGYSMVTDGSDGVYVRIRYPYATPPTRMIDVNRKRAR